MFMLINVYCQCEVVIFSMLLSYESYLLMLFVNIHVIVVNIILSFFFFVGVVIVLVPFFN